jgi:uncharacterized membrane protein YphA (DoxX/SURF4 family)
MNYKVLNITLWVVQILLGGMFLMAGFMKASTPILELSQTVNWAPDIPELLVRFIGVCEALGGVGLILPSLFRIRPKLTVYAAAGLLTIMVFAAIFHAIRFEFPAIGFNAILGLLALFVFWGRSKKAPIKARN